MKKILFCGTILLTFLSCNNKIEKVERAFYYWKSNEWRISQKEDSIIKKIGIQKIYVKFFEVDNSEVLGNFPISKSNLRIDEEFKYNIIPTIFIKNDVFLKSNQKAIDSLVLNVNFLLNKKLKENYEKNMITELQMDCDWTLKSKENYFYFLKKIKEISKKKISCTLRLYPYKYPNKMGIPPVDKATLMCYNLINPLENHTKNSILDLKELESYLNTEKKYPVPLDVALPIYSWMQVYQNNEFSEVIYNNLNEINTVLKPIKPLWFEVTKDTVFNYDTYLRVGDKIKYEETTAKKITEAIKIIKKNVSFQKNTTVTLFHLDEQQLNKFSNKEFSSFYTAFSK